MSVPTDPTRAGDPGWPVTPDPAQPVTPDPGWPVTPDPAQPSTTPHPGRPTSPDPTQPPDREPSRPSSPDPTQPPGPDPSRPGLSSRAPDAEPARRTGRRRRDTDPGPVEVRGEVPRAAPAPLGPGVPSARAGGNAVGWTALLLAVVLTAWQAVYALAAEQVSDPDLYRSVALFVSLVLGLAAAVLGVVALAQRRLPRWPGLVALAVGLHVFLVSVFSWVGGIAGGS